MEVVASGFQSEIAKKGNTRDGILTNQNLETDEVIEFDPQMGELVDELPKPKQVKYPAYGNPQLDAEIDRTEQELQAMDETCVRIARSIKEKKLVQRCLRWQLARQNETYEKFISMNEKKKYKLDDQQKSLLQFQKNKEDGLKNVLCESQNRFCSTPEKSTDDLCSSEKELNDRIRSLHTRLLCGENKFAQEKQLLGEIKQLEAAREKVIANDSMKELRINSQKEDNFRYEDDRIRWELGRKRFRYQITLKEMNLVRSKCEKRAILGSVRALEVELYHFSMKISTLEPKLKTIKRTMKAELRLRV